MHNLRSIALLLVHLEGERLEDVTDALEENLHVLKLHRHKIQLHQVLEREEAGPQVHAGVAQNVHL